MALRKQHFDDEHIDNVQKQQVEKTNTAGIKKRSRITIDVTPELQQRIKIAAIENNLSLSDYLGGILEKTVPEKSVLKRERQPINPEAVERLKLLQEKIMERRGGKPFEDSTELIRQMREERTQYLMELHKQKGKE